MVNNLILAFEGLVACASWPHLKELIIYDNPLTRTSKGMPPLVQECLVDDKVIPITSEKWLQKDIHGCTRTLQHALRHPLTLLQHNRHDCGNAHITTLNPIQRDSQLKMVPCSVEGSHKVGPSPILQRLKRVLDDIQTKSLDTNILTPRTSKDRQKVSKLWKEGRKLLAEMQAHYDNVRADSLDAVISLVQKQQSPVLK